jgi:hypothetical protein
LRAPVDETGVGNVPVNGKGCQLDSCIDTILTLVLCHTMKLG